MVFGHWITQADSKPHCWVQLAKRLKYLAAIFLVASSPIYASDAPPNSCQKPLYLTFDTGHMEVAPLVADVLSRQNVKVTFFAANERTKVGDGSLGEHWSAWWKARASEGHEFASHTLDHMYWRADMPAKQGGGFRVRPTAGAREGQEFVVEPSGYCAQIQAAANRLELLTGKKTLPLYRAPGGKTSPQLLSSAKACGYMHVGWSDAGFLGDELPSATFTNDALLRKALREIRSGDILLAHLGIWSRKDPWAPAVLEPLLVGLKAKGFCFLTLRQHPAYSAWIVSHAR
jgi:peptidoglycan/xylan/chitin deacetylase (PgdA/CDA1 family)